MHVEEINIVHVPFVKGIGKKIALSKMTLYTELNGYRLI